MAGDDREYPSRMQGSGRGPTKGIGSGYADNQRLAGAQRPEAAARIAGAPDAEVQAQADEVQATEAEYDAVAEDVVIAILEGVWAPETGGWKKVPETHDEWLVHVRQMPRDMLNAWHEDVKTAYTDKIEAEDEATLRRQLGAQALGIDPSDPLYDPLTDKLRRKAIESDLKPLDFEEMVFKGHTRQDVTLRENFVLTFRTIPTLHGLWLEHLMANTPESSVQHTRHLFSLMQVAASLDAVNGRPTGTDLTKLTKEEHKEQFGTAMEGRMEFLGKLPSQLTDDIIVQYVWFTGRVRLLLSGDLMRKVGNS